MARRTALGVATRYALTAGEGATNYAGVTLPDGLTGVALYRDADAQRLTATRAAMDCRCGAGERVIDALTASSDPSGSHVHPDGTADDDGALFIESLTANNARGDAPVDATALRSDAVLWNIGDTLPTALVNRDKRLRAATVAELHRLTGNRR